MIVSNNPFPSVLLAEQDPDGPPSIPTPGTDEHRLFIGDDGILYTIDENDTVTAVQGATPDAAGVSYTPDDGDDWGTDPDDVAEALDQLSARATMVEDAVGTLITSEATAIHDNVAGEIAAVTEKTSPHADDLLLIEDSEDTNAKKSVKISNLPTGGGGSVGDMLDVQFIRKSSDETLDTSSTLQDDDELVFAAGANETWEFEFVLRVGIDGTATVDMKLGLTTPSGATVNFAVLGPAVTSPNVGDSNVWMVHEDETREHTVGTHVSNGAEGLVWVKGLIANGATPGDVQLQWAQNSSTGTNLRVFAGSYLVARRFA
jgi:hypothetical protein